MRILVLNAGSSSVKCSVFDTADGSQPFKDEIDHARDVEAALMELPQRLEQAGQHAFDAIGHRVAHGGEAFTEACIIDAAVIADIEACVPLAPLHNPPILAGIRMAMARWPVPQVAVFDTAFHQTMPPCAYTYAVPGPWRAAGLRRYGFHGTSHRYIMERTAQACAKPAEDLRIISCHLGNGASVCAIAYGRSIDTSMGMTPLEGLVMGTRSGDVDPGIFNYLHRTLGLTIAQIEDALYHESGLKALSGHGNDMRDILAARATDPAAALAFDLYAYRVKKYIGAYAAAMDGVDAITFTGGIGEHCAPMRAAICAGLDFFGIVLDEARNAALVLEAYEAPAIHAASARVQLFVTQTREQWMIARQTQEVLTRSGV